MRDPVNEKFSNLTAKVNDFIEEDCMHNGNRARLDSVFNTDVSMAKQPEKKEGKVDECSKTTTRSNFS